MFSSHLLPDVLSSITGRDITETKRNLYRYFVYANALLPNRDTQVMVEAAQTLGRIAHLGGPTFGEQFMDFHVGQAVELLQKPSSTNGRYAAVLVLAELAKTTPVYFHSHISLVLEKIMLPLRDSQVRKESEPP